ncbi:uncharacterized protein LOC128217670 isoform X2 [Mya arenaria]|uniref:uncharacterized protein LOC128217670 isoform X2 n=1 Tax=Mya arenaria TaxID=6604 RepID=UPI0022DE9E22|nr:uncharacterized protein LOC128217670 isoform X2 [Mya arenaria]
MQLLPTLIAVSIAIGNVSCLKIATYNIWNLMFNWEIRKHHISELIVQTDADVIALQEVRSKNGSSRNQLLELKALLPAQYRWHFFRAANIVSFPKEMIDTFFDGEGIGIISRLPITGSSVTYLLPSPQDPDKNKRIILHVKIEDGRGKVYNVVALHFSYYRQQQCSNIAEVVSYVKTFSRTGKSSRQNSCQQQSSSHCG